MENNENNGANEIGEINGQPPGEPNEPIEPDQPLETGGADGQPPQKKWWRSKGLWIGCAVVLAIVAVAVAVRYGGGQPAIRLTAMTEADGALTLTEPGGEIAPDSAFRLEVDRDPQPTLDEIREAVSAAPEVLFDIAELEGGGYRLTPLKMMAAGSELTITVYGRSFSFQVENRLLVTTAFPRDGAVGVPVNSGIEFLFNTDALTKEAFQEHFTIEPAVAGSVEYGNGRFVFYPESGMAFGTRYTVVLDSGLATPGGAALGADYALTFTTQNELDEKLQYMFQISGSGLSVNSLASETPLVQAYIDSSIFDPEQAVDITLHAYESWEDYKAALERSAPQEVYSSLPTVIDTADLTEYAAFSITPIKAQAGEESYDNGACVLQFPEPLPEGWYAATFSLDIDGNAATRQIFLQVSDLSVFYMALEEEMVVWINDAATGNPVEGAEIQVEGAYRATSVTGADGAAHIRDGVPLGDQEERQVATRFTIRAGDRVYVDGDIYYSTYQDEGAEARRYMTYLFTDRPLYHTTDTVQVWGMVRGRHADTPAPQDLKLVLGDDVVTVPVTPLPDGTFTATLELENMLANYWSPLRLMAGELELRYDSLRIEDFVKPVYTASTAAEKPVYLLESSGSDTVTVMADVSTYDGTPVSSFGVNLNAWAEGMQVLGGEAHATDRQGHAEAQIRINRSNVETWYPQTYNYEFSSSEAQQENFYLPGAVYGIHRDVMFTATPVVKTGGTELTVRTHRVDISRIQTPEQIWEKDALKGEALSQPVRATVYKVFYEKQAIGTHYDFVSRSTVTTYKYVRREEVVDSLQFDTAGGEYVLTGLPVSNNEMCYFVRLETADSKNRTVRTTAWLGDIYTPYSRGGGTHRYELIKESNFANAVLRDSGDDVFLEDQLHQFEDGEDVTFRLMDNDLPIEAMQGRILYSVVQDGFGALTISGQDQVTLPFAEENLPNYIITGAYFDGKHIFALENTYMHFDPRKRELEIQLTPDKDSYRPGEDMAVTATVTNKVTGRPAADTAVVISVVDEAVFAIQEQYPYILNRLYESVYFPYIRKYTSYLQLDLGGPGEKGGGGDGGMRRDFADTAYFATGRTGADGKTAFHCRLPDNITSWRLTSVALSPENHAGNTKANVVSTKDFFVLPVVNQTLLAGDSFNVGIYGTGAQVQETDTVRYKITLTTPGGAQTREVSATLREYAEAGFGPLEKGDYTVTIEAACGPYQDGVELPVSVIASGVEVSLVKSFDLADGIAVDPLRYPVSVTFYGAEAKTYNTVFQSVHSMTAGGRADMRLARWYVARKFQEQGAQWYDRAALEADYSDLTGYNLLSLLPYSEPDIGLTVRAHLAMPGAVSLEGARYTDPVNNVDFAGPLSAFYLGKALAEEPMGLDYNGMLESGESLDFVDKMYLVMAMAVEGDTDGAHHWYDTLVKANLAELTGLAGDKALYVSLASESRSEADCTAAATMLATMLEADEAHGLARYLAEKKSPYEPFLLEQIHYLERFAPSPENPAGFTYQRDGETFAVELGQAFTSLTFNRQQLAEASFQVTAGQVFADVYYAGAPAQTADDSLKRIGFTKTVEPVGNGFAVGELVKITLTPDLSGLDRDIGDTMLVVDDYIPTGMRFERYDYDFYNDSTSRGWYMNSRQGQRLQFTVYGAGGAGIKPVVYYARCATAGEYVVESAYITSASSATWGASDRSMVEIP